MSDPDPSYTEVELLARLEALLFVAPGPVNPSQLAAALDVSTEEVESGLNRLAEALHQRGLRLQSHQNLVQLTTAPELAPLIERFLGLEATSHLSRAALEALAIIAYEQPATRPQVEAIRGVNSDGVMKSLLSKGLLQEVGRADGPGRPILYSTTPDFLQHFGLNSLEELPALDDGQPHGEPDQAEPG
jgi:segregation and condensation protein B